MNRTASRRVFLTSSTLALTGGIAVSSHIHAAGSDLLRIGLVGCGGRGTGAAAQALSADPNVKLVAMGDAFADPIESSLAALRNKAKVASKVDVPKERQFVGFDAYHSVIAASDVVLLCSPPHFRPIHLKAAVDAGKHVFAEKPVAVDAPGVRSVLATAALAKTKGLSLVSGLCLRYFDGFREVVKRVHDGSAGEIIALQANDYRTGRRAVAPVPGWTGMQAHVRNWFNYTWLSGDFNVEQHIHFLDVCSWLLGDRYPTKAMGLGGRQVLTGPEHGDSYDHFSVVYEFAGGTKLFSNCRQQPKCQSDLSVEVLGSRGRVLMTEGNRGISISGEMPWTFPGPHNDLYQTEHDELFASIRNGKPINNGEYMAKSTLLAIMGRMAAYTGKLVTWEMALNSKEDLSPSKYDWHAAPPAAMVPIPGVTKFS